ncbi:hypothetical protein [Shewanella livingstonensis]|uniref:Uncharacterized protein n=1 Tax=Shewanella livingstonensis TaxID=150120 RepID=A0A3G8LRS7_9GAMM|nr:hypothetical protein [Shewanella livingstonensis]AZG72144.1 hypothetical protein EGC82_04820 [Shewanella livingstonensis]
MDVIEVYTLEPYCRTSVHNPNKVDLFQPLAIALIIHVMLIFLIALFWEQDTDQRTSDLPATPKTKAIRSYLLSSKQYQSMINTLPKPNDLDDIQQNSHHSNTRLGLSSAKTQTETSMTMREVSVINNFMLPEKKYSDTQISIRACIKLIKTTNSITQHQIIQYPSEALFSVPQVNLYNNTI